jgi:hypothetical protein
MSGASRIVRQSLLFFVLAFGLAVIGLFPSPERLGLAVERLAAWGSPPQPKPIQTAQLGRAKRAFFGRLDAAGTRVGAGSPRQIRPGR